MKRSPGYSLTELVVTLAVAMILISVGLPAFLRAYHSYQLSNAAMQVKDMMLLTRYEAIRLNKQISCIIQPSATNPGMTSLWADSIVNNQLDPTEKTILLGTSGNLVVSGTVPGTSTLFTALGSLVPTAPSPSGSVVTFDARGAVIPPTNVTVFYLASHDAPEAGYRAVLLLPAGSVQMWTSDTTGNWLQQQ
ncbi:MAG: GspH/FimT family pseudopilin [Candidatus Acidiferrum sp.]